MVKMFGLVLVGILVATFVPAIPTHIHNLTGM